ncbi:MAG: Gfo/Idh/MocA family protein [Candidatus Binatia bacterium]
MTHRIDGVQPKLRIGVIGIGFGQQVHVPAFRSDPRCDVVAVCASTQERAESVALRLGIRKAYGEWFDLVEDPEIDAVTIAVPPSLQASVALAALVRSKHVFCEKPLTTSSQKASALVTSVEQSGVANMVDFWFPEVDEWTQAKTILVRRGIGSVHHVALSWQVETYASRMGIRSWKTQEAGGGGILNSFVSHVFYNLEWLIGPIGKLWAGSFRETRREWGGDTFSVLCLELESGVPVSASVSSNAFMGSGHRIEVYGDEGTLILENRTSDYADGFRVGYGTRGTDKVNMAPSEGRLSSSAQDGRVVAVGRLARRFIDWILTGVSTGPTFNDGYRVQRLLDAARESHRIGSWVDVRDGLSVHKGGVSSRQERSSRRTEAR